MLRLNNYLDVHLSCSSIFCVNLSTGSSLLIACLRYKEKKNDPPSASGFADLKEMLEAPKEAILSAVNDRITGLQPAIIVKQEDLCQLKNHNRQLLRREGREQGAV